MAEGVDIAKKWGHRLRLDERTSTVDDAAGAQSMGSNMPTDEVRRTQDVIVNEKDQLTAGGPKSGIAGRGGPGVPLPDAAQRDGGAGDAQLDDRGNRLRRAVVNDDDLDGVQAARVARQQRVEGRSESFAPVVSRNNHAGKHGVRLPFTIGLLLTPPLGRLGPRQPAFSRVGNAGSAVLGRTVFSRQNECAAGPDENRVRRASHTRAAAGLWSGAAR